MSSVMCSRRSSSRASKPSVDGMSASFLEDLGNHLGRQVSGVEKVVDLGQAEPEGLHQFLAVFVVALAELREAKIGGLPEPCGKA